MKQSDPIKFFNLLNWIDGQPLKEVIEPYRKQIFQEALYSLDRQTAPRYNLVLTGRAKKNWKSVDLILAALYRLLAWQSPLGNQCYLIANDAGQAGDDLEIAKKLIRANSILAAEVVIKKDVIERRDLKGYLEILPAGDVAGAHGKTYLFCGLDEIHTYRSWDILEAMAPDPHRPDTLQWITSYASLYDHPGAPLHDLCEQGKADVDAKMFFSWFSADYCSDPEYHALAGPEARANPSTLPEGYLAQQKRRLPSHRYRRLHLNLPGAPEGAYFQAELIDAAVDEGRGVLPYDPANHYTAFVDMSGGSSDDATLAIAHREGDRTVIDGVWDQGQRPPFDPRDAVKRFCGVLKGYGIARVVGDRYAGNAFYSDFGGQGIQYHACQTPKSALYESLEVEMNSGKVSLPDFPKLVKQVLSLVMKGGGKIDHPSGEHDDLANVTAGVVHLLKDEAVVNDVDYERDVHLTPRGEAEADFFSQHGGGGLLGGDLVSPWDI